MRLLAALLLCVVGLAGSTLHRRAPDAPLPHDAYIWQRAWTPAVVSAAGNSSDIVRSWRVLLAEADRDGGWTAVRVSWRDLEATQRPVIGVIRIDGRLDEARMPALLDRVAAAIDGKPIAGVEIDYDCPTSKLSTYAVFLRELRRRLPPSLALSITALPTWMNAGAALETLARPLDEIVLQVHAVDDPRRGLFDPDQAERWVHEFGRRIAKPFRVALPAYDVRVTFRADGRLASVEGEVPLLKGGDGERLSAPPARVLGLLQSLQRNAPESLTGIVWFRLPTDADRNAWSASTWRAVVSGHLPETKLGAELVATDKPGLWTVTLSNQGTVDAALPRQVKLDATCTLADGANGYRLAAPLALEAPGGGSLRAGKTRVIGWARCNEPRRQLDVAG